MTAQSSRTAGAKVNSRNETSDQWLRNAVLTAGLKEHEGHKFFDMNTGVVSEKITILPRDQARGVLPALADGLVLLRYLSNLGYIQVHQDPTVLAALQLYLNGAQGFYVGEGLMQHRVSSNQIMLIRGALEPADKKGFDAAISLHIGRVTSPYVTERETVFGVDEGDVNKAEGISQKLADGDYGGAAEDAGGDIAKGAAIGASIAAATAAGGSIALAATATGAAIGTAIPVPVIGTAAGAAIGATVAAAIVLGNAIFGSTPAFNDGDYSRMQQRQKESGAVELVGGVPPDLYGACKYKDGSVSGGDWPFPGTWNHEIRDLEAYKRNWTALCESLGASSYYQFPNKPMRGICVFPDGYSTDGGEFWKPVWPDDKRAAHEADQAARKLQYTNLGNYVNGLKEIDKMFTAADAAMRKPGATKAQRDIWFQKIGEAFQKIFLATGQDKFARLDVSGFVNDPFNQRRVAMPAPPALPKMANLAKMKISVAALKPPAATAGAAITRGMMGAAPAQKVELMKNVAAQPIAATGAKIVVNQVAFARKNFWHKVLYLFGLET